MKRQRINRRQFVQRTALATAAATVGASGLSQAVGAAAETPDPTRTRSYNENMEYRRLGRTGLMVSAVSIGGHWKQIPFAHGSEDFKKNRREVMAACIDHGINYADPCGAGEVLVYAEALGKNREKVYFGFGGQHVDHPVKRSERVIAGGRRPSAVDRPASPEAPPQLAGPGGNPVSRRDCSIYEHYTTAV